MSLAGERTRRSLAEAEKTPWFVIAGVYMVPLCFLTFADVPLYAAGLAVGWIVGGYFLFVNDQTPRNPRRTGAARKARR